MTRPIFWVLWDYGQGGLWALVRAESADQITAKFPQLEAFESAPIALSEETKARVSHAGVQDLEAAPSGWLTDFVPPPRRSFSSPADFQGLLELVQRQLRNGTLKQCYTGHPDSPQIDVLRLPPGGPWPDIVEADFVDLQGHGYHLLVDCYHGTGGEWRSTDAGK
jgi:hypothetical protein